MGLELLKALMGINPRIQVVESDDEADGNPAVRHVVNESAAKLLVPQRPSHGMNDAAADRFLAGYIPNLFHPCRINLGILAGGKIEFLGELLCQRAASTFRQNRHLRANIDTRF